MLLIDELTHFTEAIYRFLRNRVRMVGIKVPPQYSGRFPRILCGANPGGIGHQFVKATFIDGAMPFRWFSGTYQSPRTSRRSSTQPLTILLTANRAGHSHGGGLFI